MSFKDLFKTPAERYGRTVPTLSAAPRAATGPALSLDSSGSSRVVDRLPRGADVIRDQIDRKERARWARPHEIDELRFRRGHVMLGKHQGQLLGYGDDKPIVTVAAARSGKTATVLKPALFTYPGSMLVLDPKGELAAETAEHRQRILEQDVYVLDKDGCSGVPASSFNPLAELDWTSPTIVDQVDSLCETIILDEHGSEGSHWTNSARALVRGLILHTLLMRESERNLVTVRQLLMLTYPPLQQLQAKLQAEGSKDAAEATQNALFMEMAAQGNAFGGALAGAGTSFLRKASRERSSIISTAETQLRFLDSLPLQASLRRSDFKLKDLADRPMTIYLCLPSGQMATHFRWLRLIVRQALAALEQRGPWERGRPHIIFLMEEFATLGYLPIMEQAAAYFPGMGVKLWAVLQDLTQLQRHYKAAWQTFLGNASVLQFFGTGDKVTLDYISDRLGSLSFVRGQFGGESDDKARDYVDKERLLYPHETAEIFARGNGSQLLIVEGRPPMAVERLTFDEVAKIRANAGELIRSR